MVIDGQLRDRLEQVREAVDLVDETRRKLGRFTPERICPWDPSLTSDGIDRLIDNSQGAPLADVKKRHGMN
jgi:hypothetical protein